MIGRQHWQIFGHIRLECHWVSGMAKKMPHDYVIWFVSWTAWVIFLHPMLLLMMKMMRMQQQHKQRLWSTVDTPKSGNTLCPRFTKEKELRVDNFEKKTRLATTLGLGERAWASERTTGGGVFARQIQTFQLMLTIAQEVVRTTFTQFCMNFRMRYVRTGCLDLLYYFLCHKCQQQLLFPHNFAYFLKLGGQ